MRSGFQENHDQTALLRPRLSPEIKQSRKSTVKPRKTRAERLVEGQGQGSSAEGKKGRFRASA